jgi:hypothetical protein
LTCLVGLADEKKTEKIIKYFIKQKANEPCPIKTVLQPIKQKDELWKKYMERHNVINKPHQYHNGAIWPFIGGFWVILLSMSNPELAKKELTRLAQLNKQDKWQFKEWFDGKNGKPKGMSRQSWNAALYLWAYHSLNNSI